MNDHDGFVLVSILLHYVDGLDVKSTIFKMPQQFPSWPSSSAMLLSILS
jgi:hypothetical protein